MSEYTPTTEEVRFCYGDMHCEDPDGPAHENECPQDAAFNRWLAAHDADVRKTTLEEAADLIEPFSGIGLANGATRADVAGGCMTVLLLSVTHRQEASDDREDSASRHRQETMTCALVMPAKSVAASSCSASIGRGSHTATLSCASRH